MENGDNSPVVIRQLNKVDGELAVLREERMKAEPIAVDLPDDLPALYRAYVENLVATLSDETVVGRAAEELRDLITAVVIHWDA